MNNLKKVLLALAVVLSHGAVAQQIVNPADYDFWRSLSSTNEFYASMKADAIATAEAATVETPSHLILGSSSLAYILDHNNKQLYTDKIRLSLDEVITNLVVGDDAVTSSVLSHELFFALLALDVIDDELDKKSLKRYQKMLEAKIMRLYIGKWDPHAWAMRMLWYRYIGDEKNFITAKEEWEIGLSEHFMPDGVSPAGSVYCTQRWTSVARTAKNISYDMMEYMGYNEYYSNPAISGHQEFLFGYSIAPFGYGIFFGDSRHTSVGDGLRKDGYIISPTTVRAARLSPEAYKYSMWQLRNAFNTKITDQKLKGLLSNYIIMAGSAANNNPLSFDTSEGELAPSRIFDNYASLISREQSTDALHLAVQNLTGNEEYHTHHEVNAIGLVGYGEVLLRNAGYDGPGRNVSVGDVTATFAYMHEMSESANVVMLGGKQHTSKIGAGIVEGIVGGDIEYFRGSTGADGAIEGTHLRDVIFMQPTVDASAYYIVMDHLKTNKANEDINVLWHPNSESMQPVEQGVEYLSEIKVADGANGPQLYSENEVTLTTFLATEPSKIEFRTTVNQESRRALPKEQQTSYIADYMVASYEAQEGAKQIMTLLFPADKNHAKGEMSRVTMGDYSGAQIVQGEVHDVALVGSGCKQGEYDGATFKAQDVVYRTLGGKLTELFVKGESFKKGGVGFEADSLVAISLSVEPKGLSVVVVCSEATKLTLHHPNAKSVTLELSEGEHKIEL